MASVWGELKRRNVVRVAIAYVIIAWLILQVGDTLAPALYLDEWVNTVLAFFLILGFPIALFFAWAFEITPQGVKKEKDVDRSQSITHITGRKFDYLIIAALALALGYFAFDKFVLDASRDAELVRTTTEALTEQVAESGDAETSDKSIAVLAFDNLSPDADNAYFAEGISEEILNVLAGIDGLTVTSRTSAFSFRGGDTPIPEIARQLGVAHVLEGSVRKQGTRVRITAQLIDAATDTHVWSDSYDRELSDIFVVQEEIAQSITTAMQGVLGTRAVKLDRPTEDLEAYQLFLLGRQLFYKRGPALDDAITALQTAVDRDPTFVGAWAYLAASAVVALTSDYGTAISEENALAIVEDASRRALELDPNQGLVIAVRAELAIYVYRELNKGFDLYHRSVNADPDNSTIRLWLGQQGFNFGYLSEALVHLKRAHELDPLVGINNGMLGIAYMASGQQALAQPRLAKAEELGWAIWDVNFHHLILSGAYESAIASLGPYSPDTNDSDVLRTSHLLAEAVRNRDPASVDALVAHMDANPLQGSYFGLSLFLVFDDRGRFFEDFSRLVVESAQWQYVMNIVWLPGYRTYVEDPRFFAIMSEADTVALWEQRGYPDGCVRISDPAGDRLDCAERYR